MKKLSMLIAMILCVTIGGVYASWTYADANTEIKGSGSVGLSLSAATQAGAAGSFALTENITSLEISETSTDNKTAKMVATYENGANQVKIALTFTPAATANDTIKEKGVHTYMYFGTNDNINWDMEEGEDKALFVFAHDKTNAIEIGTIGSGETYVWDLNEETGIFTCEVVLDLADFVALGGTFQLNNINDYTEFEQALKGTKDNATADIHIHVTTVDPNPAN